MSKPEKPQKKRNIAKNLAAIAKHFGLTRAAITGWTKFEDFPAPLENGSYDLDEVDAWKTAQGFKGGERPEMSLLREDQIRIKNDMLRFEFEVLKGKYTANEKIVQSMIAIAERQKGVLRQKLEIEFPVLVDGLPATQVRKYSIEVVDQLCKIFQEGIEQWKQTQS